MNESFLLRFKAGNRYWTVIDLSPTDGIKFAELQDDEWHPVTFEFDARDDPISQGAVNQVRSDHSWHPWQFDLSFTREEGSVRVSGVDDYALPPVHYWCRVRIQDVEISGGKLDFQIRQSSSSASHQTFGTSNSTSRHAMTWTSATSYPSRAHSRAARWKPG